MGEKISISDLTLDALTAYIVGLGQPKFRAKQIFKWLHQKLVTEFSQMTDQPKALLAQLEEQCTIAAPVIRRRQQSRDGTVKYLLQLADGNCIETVLMRYKYGIPMLTPSGQEMISRKSITLLKLCSGSPMPIKTMWETRSPVSFCAV